MTRLKCILASMALSLALVSIGLVTCVSAQSSRSATAASYLERGAKWLAKGDERRAIADFELAIATDPSRAGTWLARASVYLRQKRLEEAERDLNKALSIDPHLTAALNDRGSTQTSPG